ncbi:MAG: lipopolysaccharide heptosyltransferase I [Magnetococcales bacterium]|nr:lipopolysaccharide heptosyltransferase I [Magnetococcales bacterium]
MKLLLVKTSSFGDVLHTLPALNDLRRHRPEIRVHWVVEEAFAQIPTWSPQVERVIPVAWRRWRGGVWQAMRSGEPEAFWRALRDQPFETILDAQGLIKSAVMARMAHGTLHGLDRASAREPWATLLYQRTHTVPVELHATERLRRLFAAALELPQPQGPADFGLEAARFATDANQAEGSTLIFLHGTTWVSKLWPVTHWQELARLASQAGMGVALPWGNTTERQRAAEIAQAAPSACRLLPPLTLAQLAARLAGARAVVATDTGPAHLAAALSTPTIGLYGPTPTERIGIVGRHVTRLCGPCPLAPCRQRVCPLKGQPNGCMRALTPQQVWQTVTEQLGM